MDSEALVWQAFTPEELSALVSGATVVTRYETYHKPNALLPNSPFFKSKRVTYDERIFVRYTPGRGVVEVQFSFEAEPAGVTDFCDRDVGYFRIPPHEELHGDFSSDF